MTKVRMQRAQRLLSLHEGLQRAEEQRVAALKGRLGELAAQQEEAIALLYSDDAHHCFIPGLVRRLKSLREEQTFIAEELERRSGELRALAARTKYAERLSRSCEQQDARRTADKELLDIIERSTRSDDASLP